MKNWTQKDIDALALKFTKREHGIVPPDSEIFGGSILPRDHVKKTTIVPRIDHILSEGVCDVSQRGKTIYTFNCVPMGKPRMTQRDRWYMNPDHSDPKKRQRSTVTRYNTLKLLVQSQAEMINFRLADCFTIIFYLPMPTKWGKAKREKMEGAPHQVNSDIDNLQKFFFDSMSKSDQTIYDVHAKKYWSVNPRIEIIQ